MAEAYKDLIKLVPTMQAVSLLSDNLPKKKKKKKSLLNQGVSNIVGLSMIKATAQMTDF
jgi:hypothetical protein